MFLVYQSNVLIDHDGHVRLSDFGLFEIVEKISITVTIADLGSARWQAPELLELQYVGPAPNPRTQAMDVYSFACICLEVCRHIKPSNIISAHENTVHRSTLAVTRIILSSMQIL
jgi:serine/threonine protein kinase